MRDYSMIIVPSFRPDLAFCRYSLFAWKPFFIHTLVKSCPVALVMGHFHCFTPFQAGMGLQRAHYKSVTNSHQSNQRPLKISSVQHLIQQGTFCHSVPNTDTFVRRLSGCYSNKDVCFQQGKVAQTACMSACQHLSTSLMQMLLDSELKQISMGAVQQFNLDVIQCECKYLVG